VNPRREMSVALGVVAVGAAIALTATRQPAALALVAVAGAGAALLVRSWARVLIGLVLLGVAAAMLATGVSPTRWAQLVGGVLIALGALAVVLRARRWPQPRSRYEAPDRRPTGTPRDTWDALDRGEDPTA
jgi:hypothetical protein